MKHNIGDLVKQKRTEHKMTLKDVSEQTDLSIGFLSQLERGRTSIAFDTLKKVAKALDIDMDYFMEQPNCKAKAVVRSYEREVLQVEGGSIVEYSMTNMAVSAAMFPKCVEIMPQKEVEETEAYSHEGEEFVYVLEGILSLKLDGEVMDLYPGDGAHYSSEISHNWSNQTNKAVKFITVNTPNFLHKSGEKE